MAEVEKKGEVVKNLAEIEGKWSATSGSDIASVTGEAADAVATSLACAANLYISESLTSFS
jgi:hypothetical protein